MSSVPNYYNGYFNQAWVQRDLGVRTNFTSNDYTYQVAMFELTGDPVIQDMSLLEHVIGSGINVALIYGDRDYQCNCKLIFLSDGIFQGKVANTRLRDRRRKHLSVHEFPYCAVLPYSWIRQPCHQFLL